MCTSVHSALTLKNEEKKVCLKIKIKNKIECRSEKKKLKEKVEVNVFSSNFSANDSPHCVIQEYHVFATKRKNIKFE